MYLIQPIIRIIKQNTTMNKISNLKQTIFAITIMVLCLSLQKAQAQAQSDKIFLKDKSVLFVDIKNSRGKTIKYRLMDDKQDTIYAIPKANIDKVVLKTGYTANYADYVDRDTVFSEFSIYPFYADMSLGLMCFGGDGFSPLGATDINIGFSFHKEQSIGLSLISWYQPSDCCGTSASGLGLQWRYRSSSNRLMLKIEGGYVSNVQYGDDGPYISKYNPQKSSKNYFRTTAALRKGLITWGLTFATTKNHVNDNFNNDTKKFIGSSTFSVSSLTFGVGIAAPQYRRKPK
jgi:hypothetical protein